MVNLSELKYLPIYDNETALIYAIKMKRRDSFEYLYNKYSGAIWYTILQMMPDQQIASELLSDVYKEIYGKIEDYNPATERFFSWIYKIIIILAVSNN